MCVKKQWSKHWNNSELDRSHRRNVFISQQQDVRFLAPTKALITCHSLIDFRCIVRRGWRRWWWKQFHLWYGHWWPTHEGIVDITRTDDDSTASLSESTDGRVDHPKYDDHLLSSHFACMSFFFSLDIQAPPQPPPPPASTFLSDFIHRSQEPTRKHPRGHFVPYRDMNCALFFIWLVF